MTQSTSKRSELDDIRKQNEYEDLMQLSDTSQFIKIRALDSGHGHPPTKYEIIYTCKGYSAPGKVAEYFKVYLTLGAAYPKELPLFQYDPSTPIYHPNVFPEYSGHRHYICIGHDDKVVSGMPLPQYVIGVGHMIQHRKGYNLTPIDLRELDGKDPNTANMPRRPEKEDIPQAPGKTTEIRIELIETTQDLDITFFDEPGAEGRSSEDDSDEIDIVIY